MTASMARSRLPFRVLVSGRIDELFGLDLRQPVPRPHALHLCSADVADPLAGRRIQQSVVRCFLRQLAQRREPLIDAGRRQAARLEVGAVLLHGGADEGRPALLLPPGEVLAMAWAYMTRVSGLDTASSTSSLTFRRGLGATSSWFILPC